MTEKSVLEPDRHNAYASEIDTLTSIAISLKRIADSLDEIRDVYKRTGESYE